MDNLGKGGAQYIHISRSVFSIETVEWNLRINEPNALDLWTFVGFPEYMDDMLYSTVFSEAHLYVTSN